MVAYWGVKDVSASNERLIEHGAKNHSEPSDVGGGILVATVIDPFGNIFGIVEKPNLKIEAGK